jgi:hypothetical protein
MYYDSNLTTDFRTSYTHEFRNAATAFNAHFAAAGDPFTLYSAPHGPGIYSFGFGVGHKDSFSSVTLDYDAQISSHFVGHVGTVTMRFRF